MNVLCNIRTTLKHLPLSNIELANMNMRIRLAPSFCKANVKFHKAIVRLTVIEPALV